MSTIAELTDDRIPLDPNTNRPPFPVVIDLPSDFYLLDTNPATWKRSTEILLRVAFNGHRLSTADRKSALAVLEQLVVQAQRGGVSLALIRMGRLSDGQVASAGIFLAWAHEKSLSSLGRVRDMLPRSGISTEIRTPVGPAIIHRSRSNAQVPGTATIVSMARIQLFVPFPDTRWTAIISTASAFPELTDALDVLIEQMARSIRLATDEEIASFPAADGAEPATGTGSVLGSNGRSTRRLLDPGPPSGVPGTQPGQQN